MYIYIHFLWFQNPEHLLVFAAGNRGDDMSGCSIVSPALGKNALAVGSSMSGANRLTTGGIDNISAFSSQGPTPDGRIKPDVLAPGHFVSHLPVFLYRVVCSCILSRSGVVSVVFKSFLSWCRRYELLLL